jgi:1,4-dihydroxy-2-naphthoate octaprenyltransferase
MLLLPSLNELFGAVEKEHVARALHPPRLIYVLLAIATLTGAVFVGYAIATVNARNWLYMIGIAGTIASATYLVAELEFPRLGHVRVDAADRTIIELRESMR